VHTKVAGYPKLADEPAGASPPPIVRYGYRSFDRQWAFEDPRWAKTESPSLWWSVSPQQAYMVSMMTNKLGTGPAATVSVGVPDFHYFCGRGGKDVIPIYRDSKGTLNVDPKLIALLQRLLVDSNTGDIVTGERLFAYAFGILAGTDYTHRYRVELDTPGPRIPLTADRTLFLRMADHGEHLLWLQTFGDRFGKGKGNLPLRGIDWKPEPSRLPADKKDIAYNAAEQELRIADGVLLGVSEDVWRFEVSGMQVISKWLGYRLARPAGKAASSKSVLDSIRPTEWTHEWSAELVEIVSVLRETLSLIPKGVGLLDEIVGGPLIAADELPAVPQALRKPPATKGSDESLFEEDE